MYRQTQLGTNKDFKHKEPRTYRESGFDSVFGKHKVQFSGIIC